MKVGCFSTSTLAAFGLAFFGTHSLAMTSQDRLFDAAWEGQPEQVIDAIEEGVSVDKKSEYGRTPLMRAAVNNTPEVARILIDHGADLERRDEKGYTAVLSAAEHADDTAMLEMLVEEGADLRLRNAKGRTALILAARSNDPAMARTLVDPRNS